MLWFEPLPYGRWALVTVIAAFALWVELRPDPTVPLPFAIVDIAPGETLDSSNTEMRRVPDGLFSPADLGATALREISTGDPVLLSDVGDPLASVPSGWWVVAVTLPVSASVGDEVTLVLLDTGDEIEGVVAHPGSDDPFAAADGGVAVPREHAADAAMAAAGGRLAVLVSTR
jgi:hypothetical protein